MATQTNLPDHILIGGYVKVAEWTGLIEDIAIGQSHIMILVSSPKQVYKNSATTILISSRFSQRSLLNNLIVISCWPLRDKQVLNV